jgi:hypothetical protein
VRSVPNRRREALKTLFDTGDTHMEGPNGTCRKIVYAQRIKTAVFIACTDHRREGSLEVGLEDRRRPPEVRVPDELARWHGPDIELRQGLPIKANDRIRVSRLSRTARDVSRGDEDISTGASDGRAGPHAATDRAGRHGKVGTDGISSRLLEGHHTPRYQRPITV